MRKIIHRMKRNVGTITAVLAIAGVCYTAYRGIKDGMKLKKNEENGKTYYTINYPFQPSEDYLGDDEYDIY